MTIGPTRTKKILISVFAVLALAQFMQPDYALVANDPANDLIAITKPASEVQHLLHVACYDRQSDGTRYPWYRRITPVNFWLKDHVDEGRDEFNMSTWGARKEKWQNTKPRKLSKCWRRRRCP